MIGLGKRRSYTETVEGRHRLLSRLLLVLLVYLAVSLSSSLLLGSWAIGSASMAPTLQPGDRVLATPLLFGPRTLFGKLPAPARPSRGDIVIVEPPYAEPPGFLPALGDSLLRFFTAQRVSLLAHGPLAGPGIERVIGVPGDTVMMEGHVFKVRPADREFFLTEFELSASDYDIAKPALPEGWKPSFPLSGTMAPIQLGRNEYFVAGDDRGSSADSRSWGPVRIERFRAKVLLRYWPLRHAGAP